MPAKISQSVTREFFSEERKEIDRGEEWGGESGGEKDANEHDSSLHRHLEHHFEVSGLTRTTIPPVVSMIADYPPEQSVGAQSVSYGGYETQRIT